jgi:hypothetical protein
MALIKLNNNSISAVSALPSGIDTGKVGQVVQTVSSTKVATTSQSFTDILTVAITPSATSSKILINFSGMVGTGGANLNNTYQITRDSTALQVPQFARSSETDANRSSVTNLLDSPSSTSAITYKMQFKCASNEMFLNRNGSNDQCGFSTLTVMEILA